MYRKIKIIKYLLATFAVFLASILIGQKNSKDYSVTSLMTPAHADIPTPPSDTSDSPGDSPSDTDSDSDSDSDSVGNDGVGVDGASDTDGPGDGSSTG